MTQVSLLDSFFNLLSFAHASLFEGCEFPWEALKKLSAYLKSQPLGKIETDIPPSAYIIHPSLVSIGRETVIEPGAYIAGPCIIGEKCVIRSGAYIRGEVVIGNGCVIGHGTEIKHSILCNRVCAAHFNYVGDSIVGSEVNLGAGVKCANFRLDRQEISIAIAGQKVNTDLRKLGAIIGDGVQVGCNCVIDPGTLLGKGSICFPCLNIFGVIPENGKIKPTHKNSVEC